jgi:hypothetical protein
MCSLIRPFLSHGNSKTCGEGQRLLVLA